VVQAGLFQSCGYQTLLPFGRALCGLAPGPRARQLQLVCINDAPNQSRKALFNLVAAGSVEHLDSLTLAADQARFAQDSEMQGQRGFGNVLFIDLQEVGTRLLAGRSHDAGVNGHAHRIGERVQNAFNRNVFHCGMEQGPHAFILCAGYKLFNSSIVMNK
jgi:hypothetical protein